MSVQVVPGRHPLRDIIRLNKEGGKAAICSICSANEYVIEAAMDKAAEHNSYMLVEATANQVNQFGGYTGMRPSDFVEFVNGIAEKAGFPRNRVILGGDHLGPLTWKNEASETAMVKAAELVREYVMAGFTKIHLDTSMKLADDDPDIMLPTLVIAERSAMLAKAAEKAFAELLAEKPASMRPVYVIGSEVPIPGGSQEEDEGINVTSVSGFEETIEIFGRTYAEAGLEEAWRNVIACVVQPGVEFGDDSIHEYDRKAAAELTGALRKYPDMAFEGHSTDYQTAKALHEMAEDGIAILKVGPALTYGLREGLFSLNLIENELFKARYDIQCSNFINTLEEVMLEKPGNWVKHYHGDEEHKRLARKYSLSDRCRYYLADPRVRASVSLLLENLGKINIPLTLLSQYMPAQYRKIREGKLKNEPAALLKDKVGDVIADYI